MPSYRQFPASVDLGDLDGSIGFKILAEGAGDRCGSEVTGAGDFNHDGVSDLFVGAMNADPTGLGNAGRVYVLWGGQDIGISGNISLSSLNSSTGLIFDSNEVYGTNGFSSGFMRHQRFDFNGDGWGDLVAGAVLLGNQNSGRGFTIFGSPEIISSGIFNYENLNGTNGFQMHGEEAGDGLGSIITPIGDFNGDGYTDILVCAQTAAPSGKSRAGRCYGIYGRQTPFQTGLFNLTTLTVNDGFVIDGEETEDLLSVATGGTDLDRDGYDDFALGAWGASHNNRTNAGCAYFIFGRPTPLNSLNINLSTLNSTTGLRLEAEFEGDRNGISLNMPEDVNGDSHPDLLIGAQNAAGLSRPLSGRSYLLFGGPNLRQYNTTLNALDNTHGVKINGATAGDRSSGTGRGSGDFNGDGINDFVIRAVNAAPEGKTNAGACFLLFGQPNLGLSGDIDLYNIDGQIGIRFDGESPESFTGQFDSCSFVGDINNDGVDDLGIGAPLLMENGASQTGRSYVVLGDIPPVITFNELRIKKGDVTVLDPTMLYAYDRNHDNSTLIYTPTDVTQGRFESTEPPYSELAFFSQSMLSNSSVQFRHNNSLAAPSYTITVTAPGGLAFSEPSTVDSTLYVPPLVSKNQLTTTEDQTTTLSTDNFDATSLNLLDDPIHYRVSNVTNGWFNYFNQPLTAITDFWDYEITAGSVQFHKDGSSFPPSCEIYVSDSIMEGGPYETDTSNFTATNDNPEVSTSPLSVQQSLNDKTIAAIDSNYLQATDEETSDASLLTYELLTPPQFGALKLVQFGSPVGLVAGSDFSQADVTSSKLTYEISNNLQTSFDSFTFRVHDPDGGASDVSTFPININPRPKSPVIESNAMRISGKQIKILTPNEILVTDPDTADTDLLLTTYDVLNGHFAYVEDINTEITSFYASEVANKRIAFVSKEEELAPSYSIRVSDGDFTVPPLSSPAESCDMSFNARPKQTILPITVDQGQPTKLSPNNLYARDQETFSDDLLFQVRNITGGTIEYSSNEGIPLSEFPQFPLMLGNVQFSQDGSDDSPGFEIRVSDRETWSDWEEVNPTLNHKPICSGNIPDQSFEVDKASQFQVNLNTLFYDPDPGQHLSYYAALEGGVPLPAEINFGVSADNTTGAFSVLFSALVSQTVVLTAADPRGLIAQTSFNIDTTPAFDWLGLYNWTGTLCGIALAVGGYFWWRRRIAQHRREYPLANEIRKILNLQYYNFQDHLGDSYKQKVEQLIIHLNLSHDDFYSKLTPEQQKEFAHCVADVLTAKKLVAEADCSYGISSWLMCFSRGWSQNLMLHEFQGSLSEIATDSIAEWKERKVIDEPQSPRLTRNKSQHNRKVKAKAFCSSACCASFWRATKRLTGCCGPEDAKPRPQSSSSKLQSSVSMAVLSADTTDNGPMSLSTIVDSPTFPPSMPS